MTVMVKAIFAFFLHLCYFQLSSEKEFQPGEEAYHAPEICNTSARDLSWYHTVEHFDLCAPSLLPSHVRDYYLDATPRRVTYNENLEAYKRLRILPKMLRDVTDVRFQTSVMGDKIKIPIGASPVALQGLASYLGEIDTVTAISEAGAVMVLSSFAGTSIEDVAKAAPNAVKWMQTYIFSKREITLDIVRRAEAAGYKALVVTVDSPSEANCPTRFSIVPNPQNITYVNLKSLANDEGGANPGLTFEDLAWLKEQTKLPIIAKGIMNADDAVTAASYGVSGIFVSNHGGRQLDYEPATIEVLPSIADAIRQSYPEVEVYVDGGVRNGLDVFKALALGARAVFVGRPVLWGLAVQGEKGVKKVFDILKNELHRTMMLAGTPSIKSIQRNMVQERGTILSALLDKNFILRNDAEHSPDHYHRYSKY